MDGDSGPEAVPSISSATGVLNNSSGLPATWEVFPLTSHKAGRQAGGLHVPAWQPGVVGQGGGTLRVRAKNSAIQVLLLAAVVRACVHNVVQVLPEEFNKYESSSFELFI